MSSKSKNKNKNKKHIEDNGAYFNIQNRYKKGSVKSKKNQDIINYKSSYEYACILMLEKNKDVVKYISEPFSIRYLDAESMPRMYIPDFLVLYSDGTTEVLEVKPLSMTKSRNVKNKAAAARSFLKKNYPLTRFRFITEKDLFANIKDYKNILKNIWYEKHFWGKL